jgi:hypothetical protein
MKRRKIDWPQVAALAVALAAVVACVLYADPEKAQAWLAIGPGVLSFLAALYSASRGRWSVPVAPVRREAETLPPEAP